MTQETKKSSQNSSVNNLSTQDEARQQIEGSLDTIKEILLGEHSREIHKKLDLLEERVGKELVTFQYQASQRFDSLESYMQNGFELIREDIKREQEERMGACDLAMEGLKNASKSFEQKITQTNQLSSSRLNELREQLLNKSHSLSNEILQRYKTLAEEINSAVSSLEIRKPDRQFMATLFKKMAGEIQGERAEETEKAVTELKSRARKSG